jgi:periplasmic protein CpxP/Spy
MKLNLIARTSALVLAGGFGLALAAHAQEGPRPHHQGGPAHHAKHDHGVRLQDLKAKLKLTPAQESAWTAFEASMKPVSSSAVPPKMEALAKMNAIQRMEERQKMHDEMQKQHAAQMSTRLAATKDFYSKLTPEQQAVFDKETLPHGPMHSADKKKTHKEGKAGPAAAPATAPAASTAAPATAPAAPAAPAATPAKAGASKT